MGLVKASSSRIPPENLFTWTVNVQPALAAFPADPGENLAARSGTARMERKGGDYAEERLAGTEVGEDRWLLGCFDAGGGGAAILALGMSASL